MISTCPAAPRNCARDARIATPTTRWRRVLADYDQSVVTSDIGCYTLGALPPYEAIESCVCMGASVGMAKGASDAGLRPALAVIGDSTFLHSGVTGLMDAVAADTDMTLLILDNEIVAMTGLQPTVLPEGRLRPIIEGLGVDPAHVHGWSRSIPAATTNWCDPPQRDGASRPVGGGGGTGVHRGHQGQPAQAAGGGDR